LIIGGIEKLSAFHPRCRRISAEVWVQLFSVAQINVVAFIQLHQVFLEEERGKSIHDVPYWVVGVVLADIAAGIQPEMRFFGPEIEQQVSVESLRGKCIPECRRNGEPCLSCILECLSVCELVIAIKTFHRIESGARHVYPEVGVFTYPVGVADQDIPWLKALVFRLPDSVAGRPAFLYFRKAVHFLVSLYFL